MIPAIFGLAGETLSPGERALIAQYRPAGFILFARNAITPPQLDALVAACKQLYPPGAPGPLILIDQEGGRVARLRPPYWDVAAPPGTFAAMAATEGLAAACKAAYESAATTARQLRAHGITVNCVPMADLRFSGSHAIIGDRAYGTEAQVAQVIRLARAVAAGTRDAGVWPVLKHLPGHGRAEQDSHHVLPVVTAPRAELAVDMAPFQALRDLPFGMTAHICYRALDAKRPATFAPAVIRLIREDIGFRGTLMSDDLCMHALSGPMAARARAALDAGCDLALHCNGVLAEMQAIARALSEDRRVWCYPPALRPDAGAQSAQAGSGYKATSRQRPESP